MVNEEWYKHNFPELFGLPPKPLGTPPILVGPTPTPVANPDLEKHNIVAPSPVVAYVGSEPVYNFDVTDQYGGSLPTNATREERIVAEGRKWVAQTAALQQAFVTGENIQVAMQKAIHVVGETVEQQKANDLLYATIEQANRQIRPSDREEYGLTSLEIPPQIIGNPEAIHRYLAQIEPLTRSLNSRWITTWYKPDKPLGGLIGKIGREFNKGLGNMGPIGKIVKPLIHLAAVASGNPYIVIGTSVTMGTLDRGAEGAVRGLMFGIMGAAGQQLAIAQQAGIPLVGENIPTGTLVSNPEALQVVQDLRVLTTEQLSMAPSRITMVGAQAVNLTEEAIRTGLYMAPMAYSYATELTASTEDPVHDALIRRRRREFYINLAGMGAGTFVSTSSIPLFEGQNTFVMSLGTGAIFGAISSGISRGRPLRGALEGALFAGAGNIIEGRLSQSEFLQEAHRLREALGVAASSALHIVVRHGRGRDILIGIGSDLLGYAIVPPGIGVLNEETLRMFVTGAIATLTSNTELGESMMAAWLGSSVQRIARQYGHDIAMSRQDRRQPKPTTNDRAEERKPSKPKAQDDTWRSNSLNIATQKASEVLEKNNIKISDKRIRRAFEKEPILQGSKEDVQRNLIALGKLDGPVRDNRSAFARGLEKAFLSVLNRLVGEAHAEELSVHRNTDTSTRQTVSAREESVSRQFLRRYSERPQEFSLSAVAGRTVGVMQSFAEGVYGLFEFFTNAAIVADGLTEPFQQDATFQTALAHNNAVVQGARYALTHPRETVDALDAALNQRLQNIHTHYATGNSFVAGLEEGRLVGDGLMLFGGGVGVARTTTQVSRTAATLGSRAIRSSASRVRQFVANHDFRSPIVFQFNSFENSVRLNAGIPFDAIKPQKPWTKKEHLKHLDKIGAKIGNEHIDITSGSRGQHAYENFAKARDVAKINANLSEGSVPFLQKVGPYRNEIYTGMQSKDGTRGWRLDYDPCDPTKAAHINWWFTPNPTKEKVRYKGMIKIEGVNYDSYLDIISHFPRM